jgi:A118 family predicted phage portal protein
MPLPTSDTVNTWPPKSLDRILPHMVQWSAWYSGELDKLQAAYGGGMAQDSTGFFASDTGGFKATVGRTLQRWFVGQRPLGNNRNTKLSIPIAAEMCQASADLLFSDPVTITVGAPAKASTKGDVATETANPTQSRLDELLDDNFHSTMAEAAEVGAALGGVYLRVTWDDKVFPDGPFSTIVDADQAIPEFKWGKLTAVTFWTVVHRDGKLVYRHLERHELNAFGVGVILHGLYEGEEDKLGTKVSLTSRTETESMALHADLNVEGTIDTLSPGLAVQYVPNQTPNRIWRTDPIGRHLGRSDLDGVEHLMDQLAETMSDWMRARRAARARTWVSKNLTKSAGPGNGTVVNLDEEVYTQVNAAGGSGGKDVGLSDQIEVTQPDFKPEQFKATADALIEQILQMAGYSMQTFGVQPEHSGERTATEIESKERRSLMTRARKIREWKPAMEEHLTKLLAVDRDFFGHPNVVTELNVEFSDGVQESQIKLGQFVQSMFVSESMSMEERVEVLHPDWDEPQKAIEVGRLKEQFGAAADPMVPPDFGPVDGSLNNGSASA